MNSGEIFRTALAEIRGHKLRSALTLLGIVLGTLSIVVMTSFLDGIVATVWQGFEDLGFDGVVYVVGREPRDPTERAIFARSPGLAPSDAESLVARGGLVLAAAPAIQDEQIVRRGSVERKAQVLGVTPAYAVARSREMGEGRFLSESDERSFARVCVIGHRMKSRFFGSEDALGGEIQVGGRPFRVVGVGKKLGNVFVQDDDFIEEMEGMYVPLATLRKLYVGETMPVHFIAVKGRDPGRLGDLQSEVAASLRIAHRGAEDFRIQNIAEEIVKARSRVTELLRNWRIVLGVIAGISLLVGGIGLMSVMLISIGERFYEIGLRKAMGATDAEVFVQFLLEAVILSLVGGGIGVGAGIGITKAASGFFPSGLPIRLDGIAIALALAVALGALYGAYPALMASRRTPVDALRSAA